MRLVLLLVFASGWLPDAGAQTVYGCRRDGVAIFQDRPCGVDQVVRELVPATPGAVAPGIEEMVANWQSRADARRGTSARPRGHGRGTQASKRKPVESHRCTSADGAVFYRHGACPARVAGRDAAARSHGVAGTGVAVVDEQVPRTIACREITRAGASTRAGHERDELADAYEHNLGRDPCG